MLFRSILETLKDVTDVQSLDVDDGLSLLAELKPAQDDPEILADADPTVPAHPQKSPGGSGEDTHTIPLKSPDQKSIPLEQSQSKSIPADPPSSAQEHPPVGDGA